MVVGIIVHADTKWRPAEDALLRTFRKIPDRWREGFVFHSASVWGDRKYRDDWSFEGRLSFLKEVMGLARNLDLPISLGMVRRSAETPPDPELSHAQLQHKLAFGMCVSSADNYLTDYTPENEVATVVAEDVTEMRGQLRSIIQKFRKEQIELSSPKHHLLTKKEREINRLTQAPIDFNIKRIVHAVHFTSKEDDPLLQIADACAFGFRRYFAEQSFGEDFLKAILGGPLVKEDWAGPASRMTFFGHWRKPVFTYRFEPSWRVQLP